MLSISINSRKRLRALAGPCLACGVLAYFSYHLLEGEHGLSASRALDFRIEQARHMHERVRSMRERLEHKVSLLRADSLDLDLLEELARSRLGFSHADELLIRLPEDGKQAG